MISLNAPRTVRAATQTHKEAHSLKIAFLYTIDFIVLSSNWITDRRISW